jgi:hypothetical protein
MREENAVYAKNQTMEDVYTNVRIKNAIKKHMLYV